MGLAQVKLTPRVLIVDDLADNRYLLETVLTDKAYETYCVASGEECLEKVAAIKPDIILLDIRMPGIDGYETCKQLRLIPSLKRTPIIFLSVLDSLDDILSGYEAGGDDYFRKPFETEILLAKMQTSIIKRQEMDQNLVESQQFAKLALANSGELGIILQCYQNSFQCQSHTQLAKVLLETCQEFGLLGSVQIRGAKDQVNIAAGGNCSNLEIELMNRLVDAQRILHFGKRTAFNFDKVTLLIKNMPLEDPDRCGRLTDHLASVLLGIETRIESLDLAIAKEREVLDRVKTSLDHIHVAIDKIESAFKTREHLTTNIIDTLLTQMTVGFSSLALTEAQEQFFIELINTHLNQIVEMYGSTTEVKDYFMQIAGDLSPLLNQVHQRPAL